MSNNIEFPITIKNAVISLEELGIAMDRWPSKLYQGLFADFTLRELSY